jgi:hypothetical protein
VLKAVFFLTFSFLLFDRAPAFHAKETTTFSMEKAPTVRSMLVFNKPGDFEDPILQADTPSCTLPFTRVGKLILLKARVDTTEGNFVLDTGAPCLVLNSTYFRKMEMIHNQNEVQSGINGEGDLAQKTMVDGLRLGTFNYHKVQTDLLDLGHIENARGVKILGLLGVSLFKECELIIDYEKNLVHLHHIRRKERKTYKNDMLSDPSQYTEHPFTLKDNRIIIQTKMAEKKMQFVIDCAAESNLIDSRLPGSILDSVQINGRIVLSGTGTKKVEAITGDMSGLTMGGLKFNGLPVIITSLENSCFGNDVCINGVLGYDFLSRYKLVFNFVTSKLYVCK